MTEELDWAELSDEDNFCEPSQLQQAGNSSTTSQPKPEGKTRRVYQKKSQNQSNPRPTENQSNSNNQNSRQNQSKNQNQNKNQNQGKVQGKNQGKGQGKSQGKGKGQGKSQGKEEKHGRNDSKDQGNAKYVKKKERGQRRKDGKNFLYSFSEVTISIDAVLSQFPDDTESQYLELMNHIAIIEQVIGEIRPVPLRRSLKEFLSQIESLLASVERVTKKNDTEQFEFVRNCLLLVDEVYYSLTLLDYDVQQVLQWKISQLVENLKLFLDFLADRHADADQKRKDQSRVCKGLILELLNELERNAQTIIDEGRTSALDSLISKGIELVNYIQDNKEAYRDQYIQLLNLADVILQYVYDAEISRLIENLISREYSYRQNFDDREAKFFFYLRRLKNHLEKTYTK